MPYSRAPVSTPSQPVLVQDEGSDLALRQTLNFVGAGVSVADSGGKTTVTIPGSGQIIDVAAYGNVGTADDAATVQAAIDAASAMGGGGVLCRQHIIGTTLNVPNAVWLIGGAPGVRVSPVTATPRGSYITAKAGTALDPMISFSNVEGCGLSNLVVDGNGLALSCVSSGGYQNKVINCEIKDATTYGLMIVGAAIGAHEFQLTNTLISMNAQGCCLYVNAHDNVFIGNVFRGGVDKGVHFDRSGGHQFLGNHLYTFPGDDTDGLLAMHLQGSAGNQIVGNYFDDWCGGPVMKIEAYGDSSRAYDNIIANNNFTATNVADNTYPMIYIDNDIGAGRPAVFATTILGNTGNSFDPSTRWTCIVHNDGQYDGLIMDNNRCAFTDMVYLGTRPGGLGKNNYVQSPLEAGAVYDDRDLRFSAYGGSKNIDGDGLTTAFTINHACTGTPRYVSITPTNANARGSSWYATKSATQITLNFASAPTNGQTYTYDFYAEL